MGTWLVLSVIAVGIAATVWLLQGAGRGAVQSAERSKGKIIEEIFDGSKYVICSAFQRDWVPEPDVISEGQARGYELTRRDGDRLYFTRFID